MRQYDPTWLVQKSWLNVTIQTSFINASEVKTGIDSAEYLDGSLRPDQFQLALKEHSQALVKQWTNSVGNIFQVQFSIADFGDETYTNVVVREHSTAENAIGLHLLDIFQPGDGLAQFS